jgi:hypothetical protein
MVNVLELFFSPPMAVARLGGSTTPLECYAWKEDPTISGAARTVIEPDVTLDVTPDGSVRPYLPANLRFRDGDQLRPVAPFFELWATVQKDGGGTEDVPLTLSVLEALGASTESLAFRVTAANRKAARRSGDPACAFQAQVRVAGNDHRRHPLLASSPHQIGSEPLVLQDRPIPLGHAQVIRPIRGVEMGVNLGVVRLRFTPARGEVYGPPEATSATSPGTNRVHQIVRPENRILNGGAAWASYDGDYSRFNNPEPSDTYDGADVFPDRNNPSWGVVDDTCDAVVEADLVVRGNRLRAAARVFVGPPDFAPDRRPFFSLADDLADRELPLPGPVTEEGQPAVEREIADLFDRVYETVSLLDVDSNRRRAIRENPRFGPTGPLPGLPPTDASTMTAADPLARLVPDLLARPVPGARLPYLDAALVAHSNLSDLDSLIAFLGTFSDRVRALVRPPYGAFTELDPAPGPQPNPGHRDPRVARDQMHDMRMPPYMRDSDASSLSLSRRQYHELMALVDRLGQQLRKAATAANLPTEPHALRAALVRRREEGQPPPAALGALETPLRRRINAFLAGLRAAGEELPPR